jgi:hypothetical protein
MILQRQIYFGASNSLSNPIQVKTEGQRMNMKGRLPLAFFDDD